jgi:hypothetical protein
LNWNTVIQYGALAGIFVGLTASILPLAMVGGLVMVRFGLPGNDGNIEDDVHDVQKPTIGRAKPKDPMP